MVEKKNAWLTGFIDAEGCFYSQSKKRPGKFDSFTQKKTLTQQDFNGGEKAIFQAILFLFESQNKVYQFTKPPSFKSKSIYVRIEFTSIASEEQIIDYLLTYKLRTIKKISFYKWRKVYLHRTNSVCFSEKSLEKTRHLVKLMNIHIHTKKLYQ